MARKFYFRIPLISGGITVGRVKIKGKSGFTLLFCLSLLVWSITPSYTHAPKVFETIQDHLEMVEDHGHSHGFEEDIFWAMHGHSHDVADHDHSQAFLLTGYRAARHLGTEDNWRVAHSAHGPSLRFRIERPPRA